MCGFILKGADKAPAEDRPSRVRQRTITVLPEEIPVSEPEEFLTDDVVEPEESFEEPHQAAEFTDYPDSEDEEPESYTTENSTIEPPPKKKRRRRRKKRHPVESVTIQPQLQEHNKQYPGEEEEMGEKDVVAPWRSAAEPRAGFRLQENLVVPTEAEQAELRPPTQPEPRAPLRSEPADEGELVGWLVSFMEDKKGVSREVRVGKFFVGAKQLRPSDFVIDDQSVSTPQCLVVCDPIRGLSVQDLMSEQGTFVKRAGTGNYERHSEQVQLKHGDFIRLGRYEMLFVALPR
jgi:hypothetical protein